LSEPLRALAEAVQRPRRNAVNRLIAWCLDHFVTEENLRHAIETQADILTLALNHFGLGHSSATPLLRLALTIYWKEVEKLLTNPEKIRRILSKKPGCANLLQTPEGITYLNTICEHSYNTLYDFVWMGKPFKPEPER
jgi:hypothetical protein